jgi:hypothetical protein
MIGREAEDFPHPAEVNPAPSPTWKFSRPQFPHSKHSAIWSTDCLLHSTLAGCPHHTVPVVQSMSFDSRIISQKQTVHAS